MSFGFSRFCFSRFSFSRLGFLFSCMFFCFSASGINCVDAFIEGSRLSYELRQVQKREISKSAQPTDTDPRIDRIKEKYWNEEPETPQLLKDFLPEGVHFLKYQQVEASTPTHIKFDEPGASLIARAHYKYHDMPFATNVVFSRRALLDNMKGEKNWLIGSSAHAAILFLHGGGTRTTGAHVARTIINHFNDLKVDVLAIDLPWHNQGHRRYVDFESEIKILSNFAKKFIPPNVPLFVWGHSYGSVFAEKLRTMTDRPKKEFLFHNNLRGVFIMSTAVDPAPGKSASEKLATIHKIREEVYENRFEESAEVEQQIHRNIIGEGKISPLGGFVAMLNLMQMDQSLPSHRGTKWIPAQMTVGIHDLLVYLGYESHYEIYKVQKNMQAHYLDKAPHLKDKTGPHKEVGHLLGDYLDPKSQKPITFVQVSNFIQDSLRVDSIKHFVLQQLQISETLTSSKYAIFKRVLEDIYFLEEIESFFKSKLLTTPLEPEIISSIQEFISLQKSTSVLQSKKNKENIPDYIYLVQEFANNLAFRDFLNSARAVEEKKTINVKSFITENLETQKKVEELLKPYGTPQSRMFHFLEGIILNQPSPQKISSLNTSVFGLNMHYNTNYLETLRKEMEHLTEVSVLKINNQALSKDLLDLKSLILVSNPSLTKDFKPILDKAREIREKYEKVWPAKVVLSNKPKKQKTSALIRDTFSHKDLDSALDIIVSRENLPQNIVDKLKPLLKKYFETKNIISGQYVPNLEVLKNLPLVQVEKVHSASTKKKRKKTKKDKLAQVEKVHSALAQNVQKIKTLNEELSKLQTEETLKREEHKEILGKVKTHIKTIREALEKASGDIPPPSLREEYKTNEKQFEELSKAQWEMEQIFDKIAVQILESRPENEGPKTTDNMQESHLSQNLKQSFLNQQSKVDIILQINKAVIEHFTNLFSRYVQDRRDLRRKTITAIEKGELGTREIRDFKTAVLALYGPHSGGQRPLLGTKSLYLDLEKTIIELAELEAKKRHLKGLLILAKMEYKNKMTSLSHLFEQREESKAFLTNLRKASNIANILNISINNVFKGRDMVISEDTPIEDVNSKALLIDYINQSGHMFKSVFTQWNDLRSHLPPILPTEP